MTTLAPPPPLPTRHGLLPEARHVILPDGIVSTGWPSVREVCRTVGILFDPWQADLNTAILAKNAQGLYAADTVAISICRQAGKTYDIGGLLFADCIINPGTLAVWTAHHFTVTRESFMSLKAMAEQPGMRAHVDPDAITTGAGNEVIPFRNGSRILFKARESGAVRGVAKVRRLVLDEAQILTERAMSDLAPTMNQAENPQVILMGTPPKPDDKSEFFKNIRRSALAGESEGLVYVEFSADPGARWDDKAQRAKANPSYPLRTGDKAINRLHKLLTGPGDFDREAFGIWDSETRAPGLIDYATWLDLSVPAADAPESGAIAYAVKFSADGERVGAAVALRPADGPVHVEAFGVAPLSDGTSSLVEWLAQRWRKASAIVVDGKAGAGDLVEQLVAADVPRRRVSIVTTDEAVTAHAGMLRAIQEGDLTHLAQPGLDAAVKVAGKRKIGTAGGWGWLSVTPDGDVTALDAVTLARHAVTTTKQRRVGSGEAVIA